MLNNKFKPGDVCVVFSSKTDIVYYKEGIELNKDLKTLKVKNYNIPMEWWHWSNATDVVFAPNKPMIVLNSEICDSEKNWYYKLFAENKAIGWVAVPNPKYYDLHNLDKSCLDFGLRKINE